MKKLMRFESVEELASTQSQETLKCWLDSYERTRKAMTDDESKQFCGETFKSAFEKLDKGDAKAAALIKAEGEIIARNEGGGVLSMSLNVRGCLPSVPNYLRGLPKNMIDVKREPKRKPVIGIYVDTGIAAQVTINQAAEAAAKIASVVTATERSGVRVNLYAVFATTKERDTFGFSVKIKDATAPLNLLNIAFPLTNPAMCRVVSLHVQECNSDKVWHGHGCIMSAKKVAETFNLDCVTLSVQDTIDCRYSVDDIARQVNNYLNKK